MKSQKKYKCQSQNSFSKERKSKQARKFDSDSIIRMGPAFCREKIHIAVHFTPMTSPPRKRFVYLKLVRRTSFPFPSPHPIFQTLPFSIKFRSFWSYLQHPFPVELSGCGFSFGIPTFLGRISEILRPLTMLRTSTSLSLCKLL